MVHKLSNEEKIKRQECLSVTIKTSICICVCVEVMDNQCDVNKITLY